MNRDIQMIDIVEVTVTEIEISDTGILWVNVDGKCCLRIQNSKLLSVRDKRKRRKKK